MIGVLIAEVDWANATKAIATSAGVFVAIVGLGAVLKQLKDAGTGIRLAGQNILLAGQSIRLNGLAAILQLEADMTARKAKVDDVNHEIMMMDANGTTNDKLAKAYARKLNAALENWFNSVDRLAFCILKDFVPEKDWRAEYRQYVAGIIEVHEEFFRANTRYHNILAVHQKWQRE